jgi:hypothetical protein
MDLRFYFLIISAKMSETMKILDSANVDATDTAEATASRAVARQKARRCSAAVVVLGIAPSKGSRV